MPTTRRRGHHKRKSVMGRIMKPIDVSSMKDLGEMEKRIRQGPITFVLVYADWCGHCHTYKPLFEKAAQSAKNRSVQVVSLNEQMLPAANTHMSQNVKSSEAINVEGYPSVIVLSPEGKKVSELDTSIRKPEQIKSAMEKSGIATATATATVPSQPKQTPMPNASEAYINTLEDAALPIAPPSQEEDKITAISPEMAENQRGGARGGSLYGSMISAAYQLAPPAILMGISSMMKRDTKGGSRKNKRITKKRRNNRK